MDELPIPKYDQIEDARLDKLVQQSLKEFHTPGLAVSIIHNGNIRAKGYGYSDLKTRSLVTPETLCFGASTTKSFTSAIAAGLVESPEHEITWQTPLAKLIHDDFVLDRRSAAGRSSTTSVTIEDALSHRTGLPRHDMIWLNGESEHQDIIRSLRFLPVHRGLRTKWEYSNVPYIAVSHALETVTGKSLDVLLELNIFGPLGMYHTTYDLDDAQNLDVEVARGHLWDEAAQKYQSVKWDDIPPSIGAGGIISNVLDYSLWFQHLMNPVNINHTLSTNAVRELRTPRMLVDKDPRRPFVGPEAYCLGLYSQTYRGRDILSHSGAIAGYMAHMLMVPPTAAEIEAGEQGWAVVTTQNSYSSCQDVVLWHLLDDFLGTPQAERFDMARAARDARASRSEYMNEGSVLKRLYGMTERPSAATRPSLPNKKFEGVYHHPAYHSLRISEATPREQAAQGDVSPLHLKPAGDSFGKISATLHHVSGDHWWAHKRSGPSSWITDEALKVCFVVGVNGEVEGMRYQAEPALEEELAFFSKIE